MKKACFFSGCKGGILDYEKRVRFVFHRHSIDHWDTLSENVRSRNGFQIRFVHANFIFALKTR